MQGISSSNPKLKDLNLSDEILIKAPENNGLLTRGIITQENSPIYDFELSFKEQVWSNPISSFI